MIAGHQLRLKGAVTRGRLLFRLTAQGPEAMRPRQCQEHSGSRLEVVPVSGKVSVVVRAQLDIFEIITDETDLTELS